MLSILLTGSGGFIGRNLKQAWSDKYHLCAPSRSELDLTNAAAVANFLDTRRFDVVVHAATWNATAVSRDDPGRIAENNCRMFFNLERCRGSYGRLISFGSGAEYVRASMPPLVSEDDFDGSVPSDPYGFSKYVIAKVIARSPDMWNLRLFGVFGPHEDWRIRFISHACCRALFDLPITIRQNVFFDYLPIENLGPVVEYFFTAVTRHSTYNVCTAQPVDLATLAHMVLAAAGKQLPVEIAQPGLGREYTGTNRRLLAEFGPMKCTRLESAVSALYSWYAERRALLNPALL